MIDVAFGVLGDDGRADGEDLIENVKEDNFTELDSCGVGNTLDFVTIRSGKSISYFALVKFQ